MKEKIKTRRGFIQIPLLIGIIVSIIATTGIGYGAIEYNKTSKIIREAEQLTKEGKYGEAIEKLEPAQNKLFGKMIFKQKISTELDTNKKLLEDKSEYNQGIEEFSKENWEEAKELLLKVSEVSPHYQDAKNKVEEAQKKITEKQIAEGVAETIIEGRIPSLIALNDEKLKNFLIDYKINQRVGFISFQAIKEDLNRDGINEIIVGFTYGGPSVGWIGLIARDDEGYYKIINWEEVLPTVSEMELKNIPNDKYQALVVKLAGGGGTGIFYQRMLVYVYINNQFKFIWEGFIERIEITGEGIGIEYLYNINFRDIDNDGNIEIIQTGIEKETRERWWGKEEKANQVENIFKWDEDKKLYTSQIP